MGNLQGHVIPSGMLRISKDGDAERVIYPVHAEGWRQLGWTVHPPVLDPELEDGLEEGPVELPVQLPDQSDPVIAGDGAAAELAAQGSGLQTLIDEPLAAAAGEVVNFQGMTRRAIATLVAERTGIEIDPNQSKTLVIAEAEAAMLAAAAEGSEVEGAIEAEADDLEGVVDVPNLLI